MPQGPELRVEGRDDVFAIGSLLEEHGLKLDPKGSDPARPTLKETRTDRGEEGGVEHLLSLVPSIVSLAGGRTTGFVVDADPDVGVAKRWTRIRDQFLSVGVAAPDEVPTNGFVGESETYKVRVGVWLMPDNRREGTLETFLRDLVDESDVLIGPAQDAARRASGIDRRFPQAASALAKAELHTWLAWQKNPGRPYGTAIQARYFRHDSPAALAFVAWFRRLYGL